MGYMKNLWVLEIDQFSMHLLYVSFLPMYLLVIVMYVPQNLIALRQQIFMNQQLLSWVPIDPVVTEVAAKT